MTLISQCSRFLTVLGVYLSLAALYLRPVHADDVTGIRETIRKRFPAVRQLSTQALADWLADPARPSPLLVDVRDTGEFKTSHLPGARHLTTAKEIRSVLKSPDAPVVVYCSVGYRSSSVAEALSQLGCTNTWNLEGAIFGWANEGRPVFRGTHRVGEVHPYSAKWGRLLQNRFHPRPKSAAKTNPERQE